MSVTSGGFRRRQGNLQPLDALLARLELRLAFVRRPNHGSVVFRAEAILELMGLLFLVVEEPTPQLQPITLFPV